MMIRNVLTVRSACCSPTSADDACRLGSAGGGALAPPSFSVYLAISQIACDLSGCGGGGSGGGGGGGGGAGGGSGGGGGRRIGSVMCRCL